MSLENVIDTLYGKLEKGYMSVTYLADTPYTRYFPVGQEDALVAYAEECGRQYNTYIGVNPRSTALASYKRGGREDICAVVCASQDFDIKGIRFSVMIPKKQPMTK